MTYYMVFGSTKRPKGFLGETYLDWHPQPVGVYEVDDVEQAFIAAAKDSNDIGTFFAIEGTAYGLEFVQSTARKLGSSGNPLERLNELTATLDSNQKQIERLIRERQSLPPGDASDE